VRTSSKEPPFIFTQNIDFFSQNVDFFTQNVDVFTQNGGITGIFLRLNQLLFRPLARTFGENPR
jgi:hypothetical protein